MPRRFLVVDDSPVVRLNLQRMLETVGVAQGDILVAEDGPTAIELFEAEHPDVVLLDIAMPGMRGEEVAHEILTSDPATKVVVVTGASRDDEEVRSLISFGAFEVLEKPIRADDLSALIRLFDQEESGAGRIR